MHNGITDLFINNENSFVDKNGNVIFSYGSTSNRPDFQSAEHRGYLYYDTDISKMLIWTGGNWRTLDGYSASMNYGTVDNRPQINEVYTGQPYFNTTLRKWNVAMRGSYWVDAMGNNADAPYYGTTEDRVSTNVRQGFMYFDTTLKKPIWWSGQNWLDATGAIV